MGLFGAATLKVGLSPLALGFHTERKIGAELIRMLEAGELRGREEPGPGRGHKRSPDSGDLLGDTLPVSGLGIADLGIAHQRASEWQRVAVLSEDAFEALLAHAREARERLAKVNFYLFDAEPADHERPTPPKPGFDMFRAGAYTLLGWRVNDEGVGGPTTNGLLTLPNDELLQLANIVKALIPAYNEAKKARE